MRNFSYFSVDQNFEIMRFSLTKILVINFSWVMVTTKFSQLSITDFHSNEIFSRCWKVLSGWNFSVAFARSFRSVWNFSNVFLIFYQIFHRILAWNSNTLYDKKRWFLIAFSFAKIMSFTTSPCHYLNGKFLPSCLGNC